MHGFDCADRGVAVTAEACPFSSRRVLITGASGFIGSHIVDRLLDLGYEVIAVHRRAAEKIPLRLRDASRRGATLVPEVDLRDCAAIRRALCAARPDAVIHAAAAGVQQQLQHDPVAVAEANVCAATALIEACSAVSLRQFVWLGTAYEYAPDEIPITELRPLRPPTLYGAVKAAAWQIADYYHRAIGLPLVTLRVFPCYGQRESASKLIPFIIGRVLRSQPLDLLTPDYQRDFLHVSDLTDAVALALSGAIAPGEVYNVASSQSLAVRDVAAAVCRIVGVPLVMRQTPGDRLPHLNRVLGNPPTLVGDASRLRALGWQPRIPLDIGLTKTIEWYRNHVDDWEAGE
jgi:UDP-glucose 4-epimerase